MYDTQHQLVGASNTIAGTTAGDYRVGFAYSAPGRLRNVCNHPQDPAGTDLVQGRTPLAYDDDDDPSVLSGYGDGSLVGGDLHAPVELFGPDQEVYYSYDFAGNVTLRQEISGQGSAGVHRWDFSYDGSNQQREVLLDDGSGGRELYYYDSAGQRYMVATYAKANDRVPERIRILNGPAETWYTPDFRNDKMEVQSEYAHLSLGGLAVGRLQREGVVTTSEASFHNGLSHLMGAVDWDTGVVNVAFVYGPYGEIIDSPSQKLEQFVGGKNSKPQQQLASGDRNAPRGGPLESASEQEDTHLRRFNGKEADQLSRLNYYGYRYYDPLSLTWTQADPLYLVAPDIAYDQPRRMSVYAFSLNNPMRYLDPDGRDTVIIAGTEAPVVKKPEDGFKTEEEWLDWVASQIKSEKYNAKHILEANSLKKELVYAFGNAVPDIGTHSGPKERDSGKTVKQIAIESVRRVEGDSGFR